MLSGAFTVLDWDPAAISNVVNRLTPRSCQVRGVFVCSHGHYGDYLILRVSLVVVAVIVIVTRYTREVSYFVGHFFAVISMLSLLPFLFLFFFLKALVDGPQKGIYPRISNTDSADVPVGMNGADNHYDNAGHLLLPLLVGFSPGGKADETTTDS